MSLMIKNSMIYGWKHTSRGKKLDYEYITQASTTKKKYTQQQINIVESYKESIENGTITKKTCQNLLDSEHGFRPSIKIVNDIIRGEYE